MAEQPTISIDIAADGVDAGPPSNARYTEPAGMLLVKLAYTQAMGTRLGTPLQRQAETEER